ncbi:MAG: transglutaminase domain-containing protein [Spirochaetales bacterium]|nr:transglutaminase domain-containing protein [Spirochaetales bacterium]
MKHQRRLKAPLFYLIFILFIAGLMTFSGCDILGIEQESEDQPAEDGADEIGEEAQSVTPLTNSYGGFLTAHNDAAILTSSNSRLSFTDPGLDSFDADGYFHLAGNVSATGTDIPYFALRLTKGDEKTYYWLTDDFSIDVWLRFSEGIYTADFFEITVVEENPNGVISSWSGTSRATITINNTNSEDGRDLYPSAPIQSDDPAIAGRAQTLKGEVSSDFEYIQAAHDWVCQYLYYDLDSISREYREKQDASSVMVNKMAVCEGYTTLYNAILRAGGVKARYITGTAGVDTIGSHAWSRVYNGGEWRYVDTTWDDPLWIIDGYPSGTSDFPDGENINHDYFWKETYSDHYGYELDMTDARGVADVQTMTSDMDFPGYPAGSY